MIKTARAVRQLNIIEEATSRQFSGGLDLADSELNLSSKYARELKNMVPGIDGSLQVRQGTRLFSDIAALTEANIVDATYFAGNIIAVDEIGQLHAVNAQGTAARIWDAEIAAALRPGLQIWGETDYVVFLEFGGDLIIGNGRDKPLNVTIGLVVDYLADLATGSNINVPVSAIIQKLSRHVAMIVDDHHLIVSERDAAGTWPGDAGAVFTGIFDLSSYVTVGDTVAQGILPFKGYLMVFFPECIVPVQLTEVLESEDVAAFLRIDVAPDSVMENTGSIAPRTLQNVGDMSLALDIVGVGNVSLSTFTKVLQSDRPSRLIDPLLQMRTGGLDAATLHNDCFAIYDRRLSMYMLFMPNDESQFSTKTPGFGYRYIKSQDIEAWNTYDGWNWKCGVRSAEGRIFFVPRDSTKIYVLGDSIIDPINKDFVGDTVAPINFAWELPWTDLKHRGLSKTLRYVILDTEGTEEFKMEVFIDDIYAVIDAGEPWSDGTFFTDGTGWIRVEPIRIPALSIDFIGKDARGFGLQSFGTSLYGGGNNTIQRKLTLAPTKFNTMKLRFSGQAMKPLRFVAITLLYQDGSIRRLL